VFINLGISTKCLPSLKHHSISRNSHICFMCKANVCDYRKFLKTIESKSKYCLSVAFFENKLGNEIRSQLLVKQSDLFTGGHTGYLVFVSYLSMCD